MGELTVLATIGSGCSPVNVPAPSSFALDIPQTPLSRAIIFVANPESVPPPLLESITAQGGGFVWLDERLCATEIRFDRFGRVTLGTSIRFGGLELVITAGSTVELLRNPERFLIRCDRNRPNAHGAIQSQQIEVGVKGREAGRITFSGSVPAAALDASIRYFYRRQEGGAGPNAFRFRVFEEGQGTVLVFDASLDPSRPTDTERNVLTASRGGTLRTNFRTPTGRAITLSAIAGESRLASQWDPARQTAYTVLAGNWQLGIEATSTLPDVDVMLGLSGLEFGKVGTDAIMQFVPGGPSYAPNFPDAEGSGARSLTAICPDSQYEVTTSWIYFNDTLGFAVAATGPSAPRGYYSQPQSAGLFTPEPGDPFLASLQLKVADFKPGVPGVFGSPHPSFPSAPYAGVDPAESDSALLGRFEVEVLSPTRSEVIFELNRTGLGPRGIKESLAGPIGLTAPTGPTGPTGPSRAAVTPQGLFSTFSNDFSLWERLLLARTENGAQRLELTSIRDKLRAALLTNQLFLVVSDPAALLEYCSVQYRVTDQVLKEASQAGIPKEVIEKAAFLLGPTYFSIAYFEPAVKQALGGDFEKWGATLIRLSELAELVISGWKFVLAPRRWDDKTILIVKFAERDVEGLIFDRSLWTMPDVFNRDPAATQEALKQIVEQAKASKAPELDYFKNTVLAGRQTFGGAEAWNGVLFLNVYVPPTEFPPELRGLAAGIDKDKFRAHHLGINVAPVEFRNGVIQPSNSSLFGLILYEDTEDLTYQGDPYDYKVLSLRVLFLNSEIAAFASQVELLVAELFGETSSLQNSTHGDNIILNGIWQKHGTKDSYVFAKEGDDVFKISSHVLDSVVISGAQFVTVIPEGGLTAGSDIATQFVLRGSLRFKALEGFDLFSFGAAPGSEGAGGRLSYSNLLISMTFTPGDESKPEFSFQAGQMAFDLASSAAREGSIYRKFPLQVTGMLQGTKSAKPADLGYIIIDSPLSPGSLGETWFGLVMSLSLGTQGGLAARTGFSATLLAAWAPGKLVYNVAVGLRLPGSEGGKKSLTIQGPLKLDIGRIAALFNKEEQAYLMRFENISLGFMSLKFPPGGRTNLLLFGDPDPKSTNQALGWYAAYKKDEKPDKTEKASNLPLSAHSGHGGDD